MKEFVAGTKVTLTWKTWRKSL